jgi:GNAT superfamily N-acetyltransferase
VIEIRDVDKADETTLHRWWEVCHDAQSDRPVDYFPAWEVARVALPTEHPDFHVELFGAYDGDRMVGAGLINLPMTDNLRMSYLDVYVDWRDRRRGVGTLLLDEVERRARAAGRELALVEVFTPPGGTSAGSGFGDARGYAVANREGAKAIDLVESEALWAPLEAEVADALGGYRIVSWRDEVPDEYVEDFGTMISGFIAMTPVGELELEDGEWTVDRLRAMERRAAEIGQTRFQAAAVSPDGRLVGCTDARVNRADPRIGYVGLTMVMPEARGHRLGLGMKLASHRAARAEFPECGLIVTSNADVNDHMNAINDALGYRVVEQLLEYQKHL